MCLLFYFASCHSPMLWGYFNVLFRCGSLVPFQGWLAHSVMVVVDGWHLLFFCIAHIWSGPCFAQAVGGVLYVLAITPCMVCCSFDARVCAYIWIRACWLTTVTYLWDPSVLYIHTYIHTHTYIHIASFTTGNNNISADKPSTLSHELLRTQWIAFIPCGIFPAF